MAAMTNQEFFSLYGGGIPTNQYPPVPSTNNTAPIPGAVATAPQQTSGLGNLFGLSPEQTNQLFGGTNAQGVTTQGIIPSVAGLGTALAQSWLGFQQYGLARDAFNFQRDAFERNFAQQTDAYNRSVRNQEVTAAAQNA